MPLQKLWFILFKVLAQLSNGSKVKLKTVSPATEKLLFDGFKNSQKIMAYLVCHFL